MKATKAIGLIVILLIIVLGYGAAYTVHQGQQALLLRLGKLVVDPATGKPYVIDPGLHFKMPFLNQVRHFDVRLQTMSVQSSRILTAEQKYVLVDYYAKWRIYNVALYYQRTGGFVTRAQTLLQQQINDALRAAFGRRTISEVISDDRASIMHLLQQRANARAKLLGISVIDVRIKTIDLPKEVSESVFARMSAQREQVAAQHRSTGRAKGEKIRANADAKATVIVAKANMKSDHVRAKGLAEAARIYSKAYNKDPRFYAFYRSLEAYRDTFNDKRDILVLQPDSQFFKYFRSASGGNSRKSKE